MSELPAANWSPTLTSAGAPNSGMAQIELESRASGAAFSFPSGNEEQPVTATLLKIDGGLLAVTAAGPTGVRCFKGIPYARPPVGAAVSLIRSVYAAVSWFCLL